MGDLPLRWSHAREGRTLSPASFWVIVLRVIFFGTRSNRSMRPLPTDGGTKARNVPVLSKRHIRQSCKARKRADARSWRVSRTVTCCLGSATTRDPSHSEEIMCVDSTLTIISGMSSCRRIEGGIPARRGRQIRPARSLWSRYQNRDEPESKHRLGWLPRRVPAPKAGDSGSSCVNAWRAARASPFPGAAICLS